MQKKRVGICFGEKEYESRFTKSLMKHYQDRLELHIYSGCDQIVAKEITTADLIIMADYIDELENVSENIKCPVIYLYDKESEKLVDIHKKSVYLVDKYQEITKIVDECLLRIDEEVKELSENFGSGDNTKITSVYSLTETKYQIPFAVTLASILGEHQKVLILDLMENSGLRQVIRSENCNETEDNMDLEELLVMAEGKTFSYNRIRSCIGHMDNVDFIFPLKNSENLGEISPDTCKTLVDILSKELEYDRIIINLGMRFQGFFQVLANSNEIYFLQKNEPLCKWRDGEFFQEINEKGLGMMTERISCVNLPKVISPITSCERLIEQWRWNELGDMIRNISSGVAQIG